MYHAFTQLPIPLSSNTATNVLSNHIGAEFKAGSSFALTIINALRAPFSVLAKRAGIHPVIVLIPQLAAIQPMSSTKNQEGATETQMAHFPIIWNQQSLGKKTPPASSNSFIIYPFLRNTLSFAEKFESSCTPPSAQSSCCPPL